MPKHRSLALEKFIFSIPWDQFERYFEKLKTARPPTGWEFINAEAMRHFLNTPENAEIAAVIEEDFQRINDVSQSGMPILVRTCQKYGISIADDEVPERLSMRLFLDYPEAFEFAWSRFLIYDPSATLSIYPLQLPSLQIQPGQIDSFQMAVREWFAGLAKGTQCVVRHFEDRGETVILIRHGSYIRTIPFWNGDEVGLNSFRPALEDVLVYDHAKSHLHVKAGLPKDRMTYLKLFASQIAGNESLAEKALQDEMFTLVPIQNGSFSFAGSGPIVGIDLVRVRMQLYGVSSPEIELKAEDVRQAFQHDLGSLTIKSGELRLAKFRFHLQYPGERLNTVTFEIEPPSRTDLAQKHHAQVIENYLTAQGVKLH